MNTLSKLLIVPVLCGLAACQTQPKESSEVANARLAVERAQARPDVARYAAGEIDQARKMLNDAERMLEEHGADDARTSHYAYLATQMAGIAEQRTLAQEAAARIKAGEQERQQILLAARERETERARTAAMQSRQEAESSEARAQQLAAQLEELQASQSSRGIVLTLDDVLFDTDRAQLKPGAYRSIDQIANFLAQHPERSVQVEGFTDSTGPDEYNLDLSQRRAEAVANAIIQRGITAQRIEARGFGEEFPVASNESAGSRQLNRRVEIIVSNDERPIPGRSAANNQ